MPQRTLLDMTQDILASMDGEEVNSITDTIESEQVARIIRQSYYDIIPSINQKAHFDLFELDASGDNDKPVLMTIPTGIVEIVWVKYDNRTTGETDPEYQPVEYLELSEFLGRTLGMKTSETNVDSMTLTNSNGIFEFKYHTDRSPLFYTTFDDNQLVFDAFETALESTLQKSKTYCWGQTEPTLALSDLAVPDLNDQQYSLLFNEAKSQCWAELKQAENTKAERRARTGWVLSKRNPNSKTPNKSEFDLMPDYGRHR